MEALVDAPLANATKVYLPAGKRSAPRGKKVEYGDEIGCPKVSAKELRERKQKAAQDKLAALFDYYARTTLDARRVAEHMGLFRNEQTGVDDAGKPVFARVLDEKRAEAKLAWRRRAA
jgi:hypothetical protein